LLFKTISIASAALRDPPIGWRRAHRPFDKADSAASQLAAWSTTMDIAFAKSPQGRATGSGDRVCPQTEAVSAFQRGVEEIQPSLA